MKNMRTPYEPNAEEKQWLERYENQAANSRCSASAGSRLADLIEQWERRARTADKLADEASASFDTRTRDRCATKAGIIRSMTEELKRELSFENDKSRCDEQN